MFEALLELLARVLHLTPEIAALVEGQSITLSPIRIHWHHTEIDLSLTVQRPALPAGRQALSQTPEMAQKP